MIEEITTNAAGGKQHKIPYRCCALFPRAILDVAEVRQKAYEVYGYDDENYKLIPVKEHLDHALGHMFEYMKNGTPEESAKEHLKHAACRVLMMLELIDIEEEQAAEERERKAYAREFGAE